MMLVLLLFCLMQYVTAARRPYKNTDSTLEDTSCALSKELCARHGIVFEPPAATANPRNVRRRDA